jgi:hypothetical protein
LGKAADDMKREPHVFEAGGHWWVAEYSGGRMIAGPFDTNEAAWCWVDRFMSRGFLT